MANPSTSSAGNDNGKLSDLHQPTRLVTTHDPSTGKAIVHSSDPFAWSPYDNANMAFSVLYTTSQSPPDLNGDADVAAHDALLARGTLGLVNPRGSVLRCVDFAPGYRCAMHRTQSLDFGIVMEGAVDMLLDSGEVHHMKRGDVAVQRATQHQWVNTSDTAWARMLFVLQPCAPLTVAGKEMGEDLGETGGLPRSEK